MPVRRQPPNLQRLSLRQIGAVFRASCEAAAAAAAGTGSEPDPDSEEAREARVRRAVRELQRVYLEGTAHYFHKDIFRECLVRSCLKGVTCIP